MGDCFKKNFRGEKGHKKYFLLKKFSNFAGGGGEIYFIFGGKKFTGMGGGNLGDFLAIGLKKNFYSKPTDLKGGKGI